MEEPVYQPKSHWWLFVLGIIMPAISITVETSTHICAEIFFDPIPTTWHVLLVVFVPLAQLHCWFAIRRGTPDRLRLAGFINAIVIGISIFYSIVYLSILPLALLTTIIGLGFLPLAPYFSLAAALAMRVKLNKIAATSASKPFSIKTRGLLVGLGVTMVVLGVIELPTALTKIGLQKAVSDIPEIRAEGIRFLRTYGSKDALVRSCYYQSGLATDLVGFAFLGKPVDPTAARQIYYLVTGETFDSSLPPERIGGRLVPQDTVDFDRDQGGSRIHGKLKGLSLANSKLEASVDADGGVGYMEWTLVFRNDSIDQREARAEVQLPPGGVVSRLTLWVNGEPREAAFAGRGKVTRAYQQVAIRQRRDPVLVTTAGRDRILVQCFPVPPNGGEMRIRFGITLPLPLEELNRAQLLLPYFADRNFRIADDVYHAVRIKSKTRLWPFNETFKSSVEGNDSILSGSIQDEDLAQARSAILVDRSDVKEMWSKDPFEPGYIVQQKIEESTPAHLQRIVIVVDTSATMYKWASHLDAAVKSLPAKFDVKLVLADVNMIAGGTAVKDLANTPDEIHPALNYANFAGGADNMPALMKAWDLAAEKPGNNAIVWVHDPQRLLIHGPEELIRRWHDRPYGPTLYSVQATRGADEIEKALDGVEEVKSVPRTGELDLDLKFLFARLTGSAKTYQLVRTSKKLDAKQTPETLETSDHLARLWANDEVARILAPQDESLESGAIILAARYQLVTPVTGAVVLETEQQYRNNDLKPVDAGTVPTIPEPEMIVLFIVAGVFMLWIAYMKYRKSGQGRCTV